MSDEKLEQLREKCDNILLYIGCSEDIADEPAEWLSKEVEDILGIFDLPRVRD